MAPFDRHVPAFGVADFPQVLTNLVVDRLAGRIGLEDADPPNLLPLGVGRERRSEKQKTDRCREPHFFTLP